MLILGSADTLCGTTRRLARLADAPVPSSVKAPLQRTLRRPLGVVREAVPGIQEALDAAGEGRREDALAVTAALVAANHLDSDAAFVHGLVLLETGQAAEAAGSLRRALYVDPTFALAAFQLGRAYDELGDAGAARRSYAQALRTLDVQDERHEALLHQIDLGDVAAACRTRLEALA
jgi:Flp pilus assembly protein TadD